MPNSFANLDAEMLTAVSFSPRNSLISLVSIFASFFGLPALELIFDWCCPHCGRSYDLLYDLMTVESYNDMNKCCRYWMKREAFNKYRQKYNATRVEK